MSHYDTQHTIGAMEHSPDVQPRTRDGRKIETENVAGGYLVFARCEEQVGRELIGFADVSEWSLIRTALAKRGLGVRAIHNLEVYDNEEVGL